MSGENWGEKGLKDVTNHVGFGILERIHMTRNADEVIVADDARALRA